MSDTMEEDDNMVIVVVGDEHYTDDQPVRVPCPITIKIEPLDESEDKTGNEMFKSPGQNFKEENDEQNIKDELEEEAEEYEVEYLEDFPEEIEFDNHDADDVDDDNDVDDDDDDEDYSEHENKKTCKMTLRKRNPKAKTPWKKTPRSKIPQSKTPRSKIPQSKTPQSKTSRKKTSLRKTLQSKTPQIKLSQSKKPQSKTPQSKTPQSKKLEDKPRKAIAFVDNLRVMYPEMASDEEFLIEQVVADMRKMKPPEPPENYCKKIKMKGKTIFECAYCGVQRDTQSAAALHYQFKHGNNYLECYACGLEYRNTTNLYKHEKRCTAPDASLALRARGHYLGRKGRGRPFITDSKFITANTPTVAKEKTKFFCSKCPASFVRREFLVAHENSHDGVRPFRCHLCPVAYTAYPALKRHLKLHGEFQYICDHCGRTFKLKPALVSHLDTHRPVRKNPCLYCERRFAQKTALRHHMNKVHLNLPAAHGCPVCPKRYARLSHVKEHMDRVHGLTLITRKMYFRTLPTMTDNEIMKTNKLFSVEVNQNPEPTEPAQEPEHILPDITDETFKESTTKTAAKKQTVQIIKKKKLKYLKQEVESDDAKQEIKEADTEPNEEEVAQPKPKKPRKPYVRTKIKVDPEPPLKIDEEINEDLCNIEYKRKKKTPASAPEKKQRDDDMHKIVRDIKSTLTTRTAATRGQKKKSSQNFYELKREFMNELKNEIEIPAESPESNEEKPELLPENISGEIVIAGTEVSEHVTSCTKKTENLPENNEPSEDDGTDDEEWKAYKDVSEKNMVIADFLQYMKSGVVPKTVPILRRGRRTKDKQ